MFRETGQQPPRTPSRRLPQVPIMYIMLSSAQPVSCLRESVLSCPLPVDLSYCHQHEPFSCFCHQDEPSSLSHEELSRPVDRRVSTNTFACGLSPRWGELLRCWPSDFPDRSGVVAQRARVTQPVRPRGLSCCNTTAGQVSGTSPAGPGTREVHSAPSVGGDGRRQGPAALPQAQAAARGRGSPRRHGSCGSPRVPRG
jgi:hypothetical protein